MSRTGSDPARGTRPSRAPHFPSRTDRNGVYAIGNENVMDGPHAPRTSAARLRHTEIWTNGVVYLVLKDTMPGTHPAEDRAAMQASIKRVLNAMLAELETVEAGGTDRLRQSIHGLAEVLDDTLSETKVFDTLQSQRDASRSTVLPLRVIRGTRLHRGDKHRTVHPAQSLARTRSRQHICVCLREPALCLALIGKFRLLFDAQPEDIGASIMARHVEAVFLSDLPREVYLRHQGNGKRAKRWQTVPTWRQPSAAMVRTKCYQLGLSSTVTAV